MSIEIHIIPEASDKAGLLALSNYLRELAGAPALVAAEPATVINVAPVTISPEPSPAVVFAPSTAAAGQIQNAPEVPPVEPTPSEPLPNVVFGGATSPVLPAPVAAATSASAGDVVAATLANGVETDIHGLPWDGRIHASTKAKVQDGSWRKRQKVDPALVTQVEAELRAALGAAPAAPVAATVPPPPAAGVPTPPPPGSPVPSTYPVLVAKITSAMTAQRLTQTDLQAALAQVGLANLPMLANRPDLVPAVDAYIDAMLGTIPQ